MGQLNQSALDIVLVDKLKTALKDSLETYNACQDAPVSYERWVDELDLSSPRIKVVFERMVNLVGGDARRRRGSLQGELGSERNIPSQTHRPQPRPPAPERHRWGLTSDRSLSSPLEPLARRYDEQTDDTYHDSDLAGVHDPVTGEPLRGSYERALRRARREIAVVESSDSSEPENDFVIVNEVVRRADPAETSRSAHRRATSARAPRHSPASVHRRQSHGMTSPERGLARWTGRGAAHDQQTPVYPAIGSAVPLNGASLQQPQTPSEGTGSQPVEPPSLRALLLSSSAGESGGSNAEARRATWANWLSAGTEESSTAGASLSRQPSLRGSRPDRSSNYGGLSSFTEIASRIRRHQRERDAAARRDDEEPRRRRMPATAVAADTFAIEDSTPAAASPGLATTLGAGWAEAAFDESYAAYFGEDV